MFSDRSFLSNEAELVGNSGGKSSVTEYQGSLKWNGGIGVGFEGSGGRRLFRGVCNSTRCRNLGRGGDLSEEDVGGLGLETKRGAFRSLKRTIVLGGMVGGGGGFGSYGLTAVQILTKTKNEKVRQPVTDGEGCSEWMRVSEGEGADWGVSGPSRQRR